MSDAAPGRGRCSVRGEKLAKPVLPGYRKLMMLTFIQQIAEMPRRGASLERLELCEAKISRTVFRGVWAG